MAKKKTPQYRRTEPVTAPVRGDQPETASSGSVAFRETIESIVVAFVLAFLFRTFEAEAFVIPTGSMSPSLQGQHKDVDCSACGYRFRTSASTEGEDRDALISRHKSVSNQIIQTTKLLQNELSPFQRSNREQELKQLKYESADLENRIQGAEVVAGMCPMCRQTMLFRTDGLPKNLPPSISTENVEFEPSYPGDRILVNKYGFGFNKPDRWDVVVFKFPGNGEMNYIKRLVGLPEEILQVFQGDIFIRPLDKSKDFQIERKPPNKVHAMLQPVHDTDYDPTILYKAGWPLRWSDSTTDGWETVVEEGEQTVSQQYKFTAAAAPGADSPVAWLRYQHLLPTDDDWSAARHLATTGKELVPKAELLAGAAPQLITDFNPYNALVQREQLLRHQPLQVAPHLLGTEWVTDLALACDVEIHEAQGELLLDIVEAGKHFICHIDLKTGKATLEIDGQADFAPTAQTPLTSAGDYRLQFANVDDQLLLWVDDKLIEFEGETGAAHYDADAVFGGRENAIPTTSDEDAGDLAPVGIGARGASLTVSRLQVFRDIYYIAINARDAQGRNYSQTEFTNYLQAAELPDGTTLPSLNDPRQIFRDPSAWGRFLTRRKREFPVKEGQYFVMGDNSPASLDCRLWKQGTSNASIPGGAYLDEQLMTGEAVCVFWPHSWGSIPGLRKLPGFPNFWDMRVVR